MMCSHCNYVELIKTAGLKVTKARLGIIEAVGAAGRPVTAGEIQTTAGGGNGMDKVTVYRTLKSFHRKGLLERVKADGQAWRYHLVNLPLHPPHPHFFCTVCGRLTCLPPGVVQLDLPALHRSLPAEIRHLEVRLEGVCPDCLAEAKT